MTRLRLRVALLLVLACASTATAQTQTPVPAPARSAAAGDKLRITMSDGRTVSATATAMTDTTLQIREGHTTRTMDLKTVSRVERVIPDPIRNGLGWGLLAGGGAGAALG